MDAEIEEANNSATTTTSSTPTTNNPFPTPTTTFNATSTSTATTIATTSAGGQPSSSRSLSRPLRSAKGRLAGAKRGTDTLLVLAEMEERAAERQEKLEEKRRKQEAELEDRRREREMQHEERMHSMFMTVFQQMMGSGWGPAPYPPMHPILPPFRSATTEDTGANPWPPTTSQYYCMQCILLSLSCPTNYLHTSVSLLSCLCTCTITTHKWLQLLTKFLMTSHMMFVP